MGGGVGGGIYCTGNIVLDVLVRPVEGMPEWGTTTLVESIAQHLGGNGAIAAFAAAKLGAQVKLAGMVGDDAGGEYALGRLRSAGVDVSCVQVVTGVQTATTVGLVNGRGERLFLHVLGASDVIEPEEIAFDAATIQGLGYFHFASIFNMPRMRRGGPALLERARAAGLQTSVDTMWDTSGKWMADFAEFCPFIDCLFVNHDEARMLAGTEEPAAVGKFFRSRGVPMTVLKMGAAGCAVLAEEEFIEPARAAAAVDTTGAGDSFCGAFLAARGRGWPLREAARLANRVAAECIQQIGGTEGLEGIHAGYLAGDGAGRGE